MTDRPSARWPGWGGLGRLARWARVAAGVALFAAGLVVVVPAITYRQWMLSLVLIEFGHAVAPASLLLLWPGWQRSWHGRVGALCGALAAACFLTPLVRALPVAQALPAQLDAAFGSAPVKPRLAGALPRGRPIDPVALFTGVAAGEVSRTRVPYTRRDGEVLSLDLYRGARPADAPPAPIVLVVHGGGWQTGSPDDLPDLNVYLASRGYVVAVPQYRLAPQHRFPAAIDDVRAAIAFLRGRAREWNADADGVVTLGRSAGAQIALLAAYDAPVGAVRGAIVFYGPADLRFAWEHPGNRWVYDGTGAIERYLGGTPQSVPQAYDAASPYLLAGEHAPPTLIVHGRKDEIVWIVQSRRLAERLAAARRPHLLVELPWATHGCDFALAGPCGQISVYAIERFLGAVTSR